MTLKEFMIKNQPLLALTRIGLRENNGTEPCGFDLESLSPELLEELKTCEEFKNVKKFNIVKYPSYFTDENGDPVQDEQPQIMKEPKLVDGENNTKELRFLTTAKNTTRGVAQTQIYKLTPELQFGEVVDLFGVLVSPVAYSSTNFKDLEEGVWLLPTIVNDSFIPQRQLRVIWNPEQLQDKLSLENVSEEKIVDSMLKQAKEFMLNKGIRSNIKGNKAIVIRCSDRSVKTKVREEKDCYV